MVNHHVPLASLGPIDWEDVPQDNLPEYLDDIFSEAQTVVDSVPSSHPAAGAKRDASQTTATDASSSTSRPRPPPRTPATVAQAQKLHKEWKEVKINPRDNPHDVKVFKLGAKDGKGSWFARVSVHEGMTFDQWRDGLQREFPETMKVQGGPGSGSIRGIGADKRVEDLDLKDAGHVQVYQLSAQFPGPTSPRDFIILLLTAETPQPGQQVPPSSKKQPLRQFMIVSKPCVHAECPTRQGIIRGSYESVEFIREVPVDDVDDAAPGDPSVKRSLSSADVKSQSSPSKDGTPRDSISSDKGRQGSSRPSTMIEWIMVTRSDPGGPIPRFMVEKGTPPGIVNDTAKFITWLKSSPASDETAPATESAETTGVVKQAPTQQIPDRTTKAALPAAPAVNSQQPSDQQQQGVGEEANWSNGLFGMITGGFGAASSAVTGGLMNQFSGARPNYADSTSSSQQLEETEDEETLSETSSIRSFTSALERSITGGDDNSNSIINRDQDSLHGSQTDEKAGQAGQAGNTNAMQIKELKKLQERRQRLDEKAAKMAERIESKRHGDKERDAAALLKARDKHEREIAKHEAKYRRELRKLEEKREQEERKAEERRKKALEREEKSNLALELAKARAERDIALKQMELLRVQVGELQAQNTMLVARLGRDGNSGDKVDSLSVGSGQKIERTASSRV